MIRVLTNGLVIDQTQTQPSRPGKAPRPIWEVSGSQLGAYRQALLDLGGKPWKGKITFWEDCTDKIEALGSDEALSFREQQELAQQRAAERADRLADRASAHASVAEQAQSTAHRIMDGIPFGQPILVGHHSEKRHRRDLGRIESNMRKAIDESSYAQQLEHRADLAEHKASGQFTKRYVQNRIDEIEAEIRDIERKLASKEIIRLRDDDESTNAQQYRQWAVNLGVRLDAARDRLSYWREELEKLGGVKYGKHNVKPGDFVKIRGRWEQVRKANPKTVGIPFPGVNGPTGWDLKYAWAEVQDYRSAEEVTNGQPV